MAHPVEDDLSNRTAAIETLEACLVIDSLRKAEQRPALVEVASAYLKRARGLDRPARKRER